MKKLIKILIIISSILLFYLSYDHECKRQSNQLINFINQKSECFDNYQHYYFEIPVRDRIRHEELIKKINDLDKVIITTGYVKQVDDNKKVIVKHIYDPDKIVWNYLEEEFVVSGDYDYLTTDLTKNNHVQLLNNNYLNGSYEFKTLDNIVNEYGEGIYDTLIYSIFYQDDSDLNYLKTIINDIYGSDLTYHSELEMIENDKVTSDYVTILIITIISLLVGIIYDVVSRYQELALVRLLGYNYISILNNYYIKTVISVILLSLISNLVCFIVVVFKINKLSLPLIKILLINNIILVLVISMIIIISIVFSNNKQIVKSLKKKNHLELLAKTCFIYKNIIAIFLFVVILASVNNIIPVINLGKSLNHQKDFFNQVYQISNVNYEINWQGVLLEEKGVIACNFFNVNNYGDDFEYNLPTIIVNDNYLKQYQIYDMNNQLMNKFNHGMVLVPKKYQTENLQNYQGTITMIQNNNCFYDPTVILETGKSIDPIIIVDNNSTYNYASAEIFLPKTRDVQYYKQLLEKLESNKEIIILDGKDKYNQVLDMLVKPVLIKYGLYGLIFLGIFYLLDITSIMIRLKNDQKEIMIKRMLGYPFFRIFKNYYLENMIVYLLPFLFSIIYLRIDFMITLLCLLCLLLFEIVIITVRLKIFISQMKILR
ncbi:hypothetical protein [Thomasclavelia sp.]|uniref:hypothetical protein n=1 Tax=Thomasclavelia sp. TaxID=3025757 RepID=UPI0025FBC91E|nr:hypothetical protein [Thomasclavelia sp.]